MANELYTSSEGDLLATEALAGSIILTLADRTSFRNHPALINAGDAAGSGSTLFEQPIVGLDGYDEMGAVAEDSAVSNTAITSSVAQITIARQAIRREMSDLLRAVDAMGVYNIERMGQSIVAEAEMRLCSMLANISDNFSTTAGTSGADLTVSDFYDAQFALELASVQGPYLWLCHPRQWADFQASLRSEGGAVQYDPSTRGLLAISGPGYRGTFNGVDIVTNTRVPTANAGADRAGGMFGRGALAYREASIPADRHLIAKGTVFAGPIMIEPDRNADKGNSVLVGSYLAGVGEYQDACGVTVVSDA